jgi:aspartyl-tRNA(Asn)/glutamyl-tRNA(Gln) amidotransferase subunit B
VTQYLVTIGLEVHAQILTESKMFCGCSANYAGAAPNTHVCPTCLGLPGSLPVINQRAIEKVALTGLALHSEIDNDSLVSRKNYTYPDLPSSYQRSQYEDPLCKGGWVTITNEKGETKQIGLTRIHLEEDTGKLTHATDGSSLIDYNRSGTPLMEIVSEPDIASPEEAKLYFQKLRQILLWIGVNSGNMEDGALRCDANVSVRPVGQKEYGAKVEIKNINSFRFVERALTYEIQRQIDVLNAGGTIKQTTRGWNELKGITVEQRTKEDADDYRYFPEPDIPPLVIDSDWVEARRQELPELPDARAERFVSEYGISTQDALQLTDEREVADFFEEVAQAAGANNGKEVSNWILGELFRLLKESGEELGEATKRFTPAHIISVIKLVASGSINRAVGKQVFEESFRSGEAPDAIVSKRGLTQISDNDTLAAMAREIIAANPKAVEEYRGGKASAIQFLVGQMMKRTKGQANPQVARSVLEQELGA